MNLETLGGATFVKPGYDTTVITTSLVLASMVGSNKIHVVLACKSNWPCLVGSMRTQTRDLRFKFHFM